MENEEEKPKKKVRGPGKRRMKLKNGKKHEVLVRKKHSNVETGLSKYQLAKREEFLKVREGETHEQYVIRTKNYRVLTPEDQAIIDNSFSGKLRKKKEEARKLKLRHYFSSQELSQVNQREFYELKYLQIVLRYCGIKFGVTSRDLKLALFFSFVTTLIIVDLTFSIGCLNSIIHTFLNYIITIDILIYQFIYF